MASPRHALPLMFTLALACGPVGDASTDAATSTDASGDATTVATNTGGDATTNATTGDALCPAPEDVGARFTVDPWEDSVDSDCTVDAVTTDLDAGGASYELICGDASLTLTIEVDPFLPPRLDLGQQVHLEYIVTPGFTTSQWLAVHSLDVPGWLLLGGVMAETLDPPGDTLSTLFKAIGIVETDTRCAPEPGVCGQQQRLALDVSAHGAVTTHFDQRVVSADDGFGAGFFLTIEAARDHIDDDLCFDYPEAWFQLITVAYASD